MTVRWYVCTLYVNHIHNQRYRFGHAQAYYTELVSRASPFTKRKGLEGSGTVPLLELFCWNAINIRKLALSCMRFTLCSNMLTTAHGLHAVRSALMCQVSTVVVRACILWSCCGSKICIFMFSKISGERTTQVTAPYQTLPLCEGAAPRDQCVIVTGWAP